jgi:drug/metabolite transporter (DMT)-like permease
MIQPTPGKAAATVLGLVAIGLWSTVFAFSRSLSERVGPLTAAACIYMIGGLLGCAYQAALGGGFGRASALPRRYLLGCGGLFVVYTVSLYLALGLASGREQVIEVAIINYLWPGLTLVFSVPLLGRRARPWLAVGTVVAFAGVVLALGQGAGLSWDAFRARVALNLLPYACALVAALTWPLYSNLSRRWASGADGAAMPLFILATATVLGLLRLLRPEETHWTPAAALELAYIAVFPTLLAYTFWDRAMRKGDQVLVVSLSYLTPLLSTLISCAYLAVPAGAGLWVACALVIGGAVLCKYSVVERSG